MQGDYLIHVCVLSVPTLNGASDKEKGLVLMKSNVRIFFHGKPLWGCL